MKRPTNNTDRLTEIAGVFQDLTRDHDPASSAANALYLIGLLEGLVENISANPTLVLINLLAKHNLLLAWPTFYSGQPVNLEWNLHKLGEFYLIVGFAERFSLAASRGPVTIDLGSLNVSQARELMRLYQEHYPQQIQLQHPSKPRR